ncbi:MAG: hypothetical protein Ct9H300mP11_14320 [Chloroflexota bacterium]|nr:MAG: hypothetical protein Ct9H300mP11_14320 [Chloroflexota bacterium]
MPKELKGDMNGQGLQIGVVVARFNEISQVNCWTLLFRPSNDMESETKT